MKHIGTVIVTLGVGFLTGCAATQTISEFGEAPTKKVCIGNTRLSEMEFSML